VITNTRKVFNPAATDKDNRVFLEVMTNTRNIRGHLKAISQTNPGDFTESGVRLLRCGCINSRTNTALLRAAL
jgi:hypothetical protein